jgi:hypothetical protein
MARPKGSKNKTVEARQPAAEFNYEDSDALYQQVMSRGAVAPAFEDPANVVEDITARYDVGAVLAPAVPPVAASSIFLVEGKVRLDQDGNSPVLADQRRIVIAANVDEALSKFVNYFANMSNAAQRYTVVQAGASETIQ